MTKKQICKEIEALKIKKRKRRKEREEAEFHQCLNHIKNSLSIGLDEFYEDSCYDFLKFQKRLENLGFKIEKLEKFTSIKKKSNVTSSMYCLVDSPLV